MRRVLLSFTCAAALGLGACGDDSTPGPSDTNQPDTTQPADTTQPDTTQPDTTQPDTTQPDVTQPDTTQPDTTEPPPTRQCTDAELSSYNVCRDGCGELDNSCMLECNGRLSNSCFDAVALFEKCVQDNRCFDEHNKPDLVCVEQFCADEVIAVVGVQEPVDCNPVTHSGCETGQICTVGDPEGNLFCIPAGDIPAFGDCSGGTTGCATGACLTSDLGSMCMPFCVTSTDCPSGSICGGRVESWPESLLVCVQLPSCDLLEPQCAAGEGCYAVETGGVCLTAGAKATGAACQALNDCAPGNVCLGQGSSYNCTKVCDVNAEVTGCAAGETCATFGGAPNSAVGACVSE